MRWARSPFDMARRESKIRTVLTFIAGTIWPYIPIVLFVAGVLLDNLWMRWIGGTAFVLTIIWALTHGLLLSVAIPVELVRSWSAQSRSEKIFSAFIIGTIGLGLGCIVACSLYLWLR